MVKITVIMSAYNAEKYIAQSIDSVLNQTYKDFEFLIVEDKSIDKTLEIIEEYTKKDHRIKLFKKEKNKGFQGYVENLNLMITKAKGEFIAKFDADDIWSENKLENQIKDMEENPEIFLLSANAYRIDENNNITDKVIRPHIEEELKEMIIHSNPFCHPSILFRNEGYKYREKMFYTEEYDLYLRMFSDGKKLIQRNDFLFYYRILENSLSRGNKTLIHALFKEKAIEFYHQRVNNGKDDYEEFEPDNFLHIFNLDYKNSEMDLNKALKLAFIANLKEDYFVLIKKARKQYGVIKFFKFYLISAFYDLSQKIYNK